MPLHTKEVSAEQYDAMVDLIEEVKATFPSADTSSLQFWLRKTKVINPNEALRESVIDIVSDAMSNLLYYDRQEDEEFPVGKIEELIKEGVISVDEILEVVRKNLEGKD